MRKLKYSNQANKFLSDLIKGNKKFAGLIYQNLEILCSNPIPTNSKKLVGSPYYRIRVGNYRVVYNFDDTTLFVIAVDTRSRIYRGL